MASIDAQAEVVAFLSAPATHQGAEVERIDTHASIVFLAGSRAWKLKRAVQYDYLDFSTPARRKAMCEAEVRINRRTAPTLYLGVTAITREAEGSLALGGTGQPIDWVVEMRRFDQDGLFDRLAARDALDIQLMAPLGSALARFHQDAEHRADHGGQSGLAWVIDGNALGFATAGDGILDPAICASLTRAARATLERVGGLLDDRRSQGFVRQCHGDLHLRNIVLIGGQPTLFDAIEFNDEIACTDVLYDLAFLLMDLWRRRLSRHANVVLNAYLADTNDLAGLALMPLFLSCRAAVRAKTSASAAKLQADPPKRAALEQLATDYLTMAGQLLRPAGPCVIAIGGPSGSGKSTLARSLAPTIGAVPGAVVIRSDEVRKRLCGIDPLVHLGPEGYTAEVSARVYATLVERATVVVRGGHSAIVDAVFTKHADREAIQQAAAASGVPFVGLWLDAPESVLVARAARRGPDASDATAEVIRKQLDDEVGPMQWQRLDASTGHQRVRQQATALLRTVVASPLLAP